MFKKFLEKVDRLLGRGVIDEQLYEELEEALIEADTHVTIVQEILEELRQAVRREKITDPEGMKERLRVSIAERFHISEGNDLNFNDSNPTVFLFVGVNGVGKTTSIAKLAERYRKQGKKVMLACGDTFRAAAIEQLEVWAKRTGADIVLAQPGSDSAAVIYDAIIAAKARGHDIVLADTAGRQHSKGNLMSELEKISGVVVKALGRPADEVLLVLDATTGQNAVRQAEEFKKTSGVTGIILTKLDGTSRGGAMMGVFQTEQIPVKLVGVGEKAEDLIDFDPEWFANQLFEG